MNYGKSEFITLKGAAKQTQKKKSTPIIYKNN